MTVDVETMLGIKGAKYKRHESLIVNKTLACALGLTKALVFQRIESWVRFNKLRRDNESWKQHLYREEKWWMFSTYEEFVERDFPFWHKDTIRKAVDSLVQEGLVLRANYNRRKADRTTWLTVNEKGYEKFKGEAKYQKAMKKANGIERRTIINKALAKAIGLNESIVIRSIQYWTDQNEAAYYKDKTAKNASNYYDDKWWTFNSNPNWVKAEFPYWSAKILERTLHNLAEKELIESLHEWLHGARRGKRHSINLDTVKKHLKEKCDAARTQPKNGFSVTRKMKTKNASVQISSGSVHLSSASGQKSPTLQVVT